MNLDLSVLDDVRSSSSPSSLPPQTAYSALPQTASTTFGANEPEPELASISRSRSSSRDAIKSLPSSSRPSSPLSASLDSELLHGSGGGGGGAAPGHGEAKVLTTLSYGAASGPGLDYVALTTTAEPPPLRPVSEPRSGLELSSSSLPLPHQSHLHHNHTLPSSSFPASAEEEETVAVSSSSSPDLEHDSLHLSVRHGEAGHDEESEQEDVGRLLALADTTTPMPIPVSFQMDEKSPWAD
ncbi:hypothetical protein D9757_011042 [Collybiopsis confluens]|uniref:Uncharacterized protein n=1 Tax=Collybiopsis confluens TaxID=2823264 RepID=A0A8H5LQ59_9AGAR|nr:hypothetical protein D9757_011042 [Collybiopsis confluens]